MDILILLLSLVVWGLIFWLFWWGLSKIALPEPFAKIATVVLILASLVVILGLLLGTIPTFHFLQSSLR